MLGKIKDFIYVNMYLNMPCREICKKKIQQSFRKLEIERAFQGLWKKIVEKSTYCEHKNICLASMREYGGVLITVSFLIFLRS